MPEIDDYLAARTEADAQCEKIRGLREEIRNFAVALGGSPRNSLHSLPAKWLSRDAVEALLKEAVAACDKMDATWAKLPANQKAHVTEPFKVAGGTFVPRAD